MNNKMQEHVMSFSKFTQKNKLNEGNENPGGLVLGQDYKVKDYGSSLYGWCDLGHTVSDMDFGSGEPLGTLVKVDKSNKIVQVEWRDELWEFTLDEFVENAEIE